MASAIDRMRKKLALNQIDTNAKKEKHSNMQPPNRFLERTTSASLSAKATLAPKA